MISAKSRVNRVNLTTGLGDNNILDSRLPHLNEPVNVVYMSSANFKNIALTVFSFSCPSGINNEPSVPLISINL